MKCSVLLDTSYLISLVDRSRPNHQIARQYYQHMLETDIPMYLSVIAVSEFEVRQSITVLPLKHFRLLSFNVVHAKSSAAFWRDLGGRKDSVTSRYVARDDVKLIAQAHREDVQFLLTEDRSSLFKYAERLNKKSASSVKAVVLSDGFMPCSFSADGQQILDLPST